MAERRRALLDAYKSIPSKHRAWLSLPPSIEGFELFCYHGWGVVPNDAQLESMQAILEHPRGTVHIWKFANRSGKTTGAMLDHEYIAFTKWGFRQDDVDEWLGYRYKTLHAAPLGNLMSKAWEIADALIDGSAIVQRSPLTNRQRPGIFIKSPIFRAGTAKSKDGQTDQLVVDCINGSRVDFLQTHSGAGRMESDAWWFIVWDEFGEHQPVDAVPYLFSSTFLPRSSDFMAPIVLSSTEKDKSAPIYAELEDMAEQNPDRWNVMAFGRAVNFSQSRESMERQVALSVDFATAQRSVYGGSAESSSGSLLPLFALKRAADPALPARRHVSDLEPVAGRTWRLIQTFDHAIKGDRNVICTAATVWPILSAEDLIRWPVQIIDMDELRGSRVLTPGEMVGFALNAWKEHGENAIWLTDATGEGGVMMHRMLRQAGIPSRDFNFTARVSQTDRRTKKGYGRTGLQRLFSLGLPVGEDGKIIVPEGVDLDRLPFGGIRIPHPRDGGTAGDILRRLYRQLAFLRADDEKLVQDHAMTVLMLAAYLLPYIERRGTRRVQQLNPFGTRRGVARVR